jgi:hypothetical protein
MSRTTRVFALSPRRGILPILPLLGACALPAAPGLHVEARLLTPISSYSSKAGAEIRTLITTPLCYAGGRIPEGVELRGSLVKVKRVGLGLIHETASIRAEFRELALPDGGDFPVEAKLESIDNARERIDSKGVIHGIRATSALSNRAGERLLFLAMGHPMAFTPLLAFQATVFHFPDPEIQYRRGTEMYLTVDLPEEWGPVEACPAAAAKAGEEQMSALQRLVDDLPYWSYSKRQSQPMDLVNLMFVGSAKALLTAFDAAGWTGSRMNSVTAGFDAIRALAERNPDDDAPMRTLTLDGSEPAFALQKTLNTFEKRHHLRVWEREAQWDGQQVWVSAATQDIATTFSVRPFGFTHEIENQVDLERDKVVSDLRYTGCVDSVTYVQRPEPVRGSGKEYRRGVTSDARVAVVKLNDCEQPRLDPAGPAGRQPSRFVRGFRRVSLVTRNHFMRDNWFWRGYEAVRMSYTAIRGWERQNRDERRARERDMRVMAQQRPAEKSMAADERR